jgi:hypothetical protein
MNSHG